MTKLQKKTANKVVIIGGGIAGLTLANALQKANIDYVLLENRHVIDPDLGASVGIQPCGGRILDQLGCWDEILTLVEPLWEYTSRDRNGDLIGQPSDVIDLMTLRSGYAIGFLERQLLLRVLANHILDQDRLLLNKKVTKIDTNQHNAIVYCEDDTAYEADVVVGADGVYSIARREAWRNAELVGEGEKFKADKDTLFAEYKCIFGISKPMHHFPAGTNHTIHDKDRSVLLIVGKGGVLYWFYFLKLDKIYRPPNIPRFTNEDADAVMEKEGDLPVLDGGRVTMRDLYKSRRIATLLALEEAEYKHWGWGRITCIGDSIHKATPNLGAMGNTAMESAVALANQLKKVADHHNPSYEVVTSALEDYQKKRDVRTHKIVEMANELTRFQALYDFKGRLVTNHVMKTIGDLAADGMADWFIGAELLDYLPVPARSLRATMPYNPEDGWGCGTNYKTRFLSALPIIGLAAVFINRVMKVDADLMAAITTRRTITSGTKSFRLAESFHGIDWLDDFWRTPVAVLTPSSFGWDAQAWWQMFPFLIDVSTIYVIWLIEGSRRANAFKPFRIPVLWGMGFQMAGIGIAGPVFFFLWWLFSPISAFRASDHRLTDVRYTYTALPLTLLFSVVPIYLSYFAPTLQQRHWHMWAWQMFPLSISVAQYLLSRAMPDTRKVDRLKNVQKDVTAIRVSVITMALLSAAAWIFTMTQSPFSLKQMFLPASIVPNDFSGQARYILQWDQIAGCGAALLWAFYSFVDIKRAGMTDMRYHEAILCAVAGVAMIGPGATFALAWLWREETFLTRRHKGALTEENLIRQGKRHLIGKDSIGGPVNGHGKEANGNGYATANGQNLAYEFDLKNSHHS